VEILDSSIELFRVLFLLGAIISLLYKKKYGITPGGIVVPGILAGILFASFRSFVVLLVTTTICWMIHRVFISKYALSSRWTTLICMSISATLGLLTMYTFRKYISFSSESSLVSLVVPGLITISAKKYGIGKIAYSTLFVTAVTGSVGVLLASLIPHQQLTSLNVQLAEYTPLTLTAPFVVIPVSLITAILIYYRFGIRGGGYVIGPFLALLMFIAPLQALSIAVAIAVSYWSMKFIQQYTLIIGLERFVASLFMGYFTITAIDYIAITAGVGQYYPSPQIAIIAVAVITNELCLQPARLSILKGVLPSLLIAYLTRLAV
jgi:hypothetical protein